MVQVKKSPKTVSLATMLINYLLGVKEGRESSRAFWDKLDSFSTDNEMLEPRFEILCCVLYNATYSTSEPWLTDAQHT